jgi:uncharacterized membrane protein
LERRNLVGIPSGGKWRRGLDHPVWYFFVLALFGTASIDAKRRRKMGAAWESFAAKTSNIPFAAVIAGRNTLNFTESLGWRFWVAVVLFLTVLFTHYHLFGVSSFPGGWVPF